MKANPSGNRQRWAGTLALVLVWWVQPQATANPERPTVTYGSATATTVGSQLTVKTSDRAFIEWKSFNIGVGESTRFVQPAPWSVIWNRINDVNPSQILGHLDANGIVVLQNQS